jgi:signal transduction histidine kinase
MPSRIDDECPLAHVLARELKLARRDLTSQWLERIANRVSIDPNRVFPTDELLNHVPLLIDGVAEYVDQPAAEISLDMPVVAKAMELGALRHQQGFDAYEILKEYEFLGGILFTFFARTVETIPEPCEKSELMACGARLYRAVTIMQQATMSHFLMLAGKQVADREDRLRGVNRVISHELKNRITAILGAGSVLQEITDLPPAKRNELTEIICRNADEMKNSVDNVLALSRMEQEDVRQHKNVKLLESVREAVRQVREAAQASAIEIRIDPGMPDIEVNAPVIELSVKNYLSNAIKYAGPSQSARLVEISGSIEERDDGGRQLVVRVRDNGIGVPVEKREKLFERYFRAHEGMSRIEGTGLGLSIVRETVELQGGDAWAEHPEGGGSIFAIGLPLRRAPGAPESRRSPQGNTMENEETAGR